MSLDPPDDDHPWDDPEPDPPEAPSVAGDEFDADPEVQSTFWRSVILTNLAVFVVALGAMLVYFRGRWLLGVVAVVAGAVAALRVIQHYRAFQERQDGEGDDADSEENA